jgi:polysaccharide biosynthesis transport protein
MESQEIDLRQIFQILLRRLWILILMPLVAAGTAGVYSRYYLTPIYQATATVWIKPEATNAINYSVYDGQAMARTYSEVATSLQVTSQAAEKLNLPDVTDELLSGQFSAEPVKDTEIMRLTITDTDPALAAKKVNVLTDAFKDEIERSEMVQRIHVVDYARVPGGPIRPNTRMNVMIAFALGLMAAGGLAFLLEYLDTSIRTPEDVQRHVKGPVLATIPFVELSQDQGKRQGRKGIVDPMLVTRQDPASAASEAFRVLRTNLQFLGLDKPLKSVLVTSAVPSEGKSVTSANLAVALAQAGVKVCLVDTDLRRPTQARIFGLDNREGLTNVLLGTMSLEQAIKEPVEGLSVLPSGPIPPNPSEMLGSKRMLRLLRELEAGFDLVILDTPPTLGLADAVTLAPQVAGVLLVIRSGGVGYPEVVKARESLAGVQANLLGMVLEGVRKTVSGHYYHYQHYYRSDETPRKSKRSKAI